MLEYLGSPIPPEKELFDCLTLSLRPWALKPVNDVVVEKFVVEIIVLKLPEMATRQCKTDLGIYC